MRLIFPIALILAGPALGQDMSSCPIHAEHMKQMATDRSASVDARGDREMGFSHEKTNHHFHLFTNGGAIEVTANDLSDTGSRDAIREHLASIAAMFSEGNFQIPMLIHDRVPPGVAVMKARRNHIRYIYEDTSQGGQVRIATADQKCLAAVHAFLRFQIADHRTGDRPTIE